VHCLGYNKWERERERAKDHTRLGNKLLCYYALLRLLRTYCVHVRPAISDHCFGRWSSDVISRAPFKRPWLILSHSLSQLLVSTRGLAQVCRPSALFFDSQRKSRDNLYLAVEAEMDGFASEVNVRQTEYIHVHHAKIEAITLYWYNTGINGIIHNNYCQCKLFWLTNCTTARGILSCS